jgi:hypothetical protein
MNEHVGVWEGSGKHNSIVNSTFACIMRYKSNYLAIVKGWVSGRGVEKKQY